MDQALLLDILQDALWTGFLIGAPLLGAALVIGVVIGILQALTSVQELTLTFVPKLVGMLVVFAATAGYMSTSLLTLYFERILPYVAGG
ncbi:MAG: flagellar biosynthetic protein FliQ [Pseudomonadota bacterium]